MVSLQSKKSSKYPQMLSCGFVAKVYGIGAPMSEIAQWVGLLGCEAGSFRFFYLGVHVGANMNLKKNWSPIIQNFQSKLSKWKSKTLSFGGHLTF
uniref:Uncharacterized protein n=1 Tax=Lactuca sativa TaxID=4236 RepID=A0A9R1W864_LACSA|nr:hypothetical protein LSAT_V11C300119580 [Lactuca sativa]